MNTATTGQKPLGRIRGAAVKRRWLHDPLIFVAPLAVFILIAFVVPLFGVALRSFGIGGNNGTFSPEYYQEIAQTPAYRGILEDTFQISIIVAVVAGLVGYPLAYWIDTLSPRAKLIALTLVVLPFWTSILVRTYAWIIILGSHGVINSTLIKLGLIGSPWSLVYNDLGVTIGMVHVLLPFLVLPLAASMSNIDKKLLLAGSSLGASNRMVFRRIYFPLTLPALSAGVMLVFILSLGFYVTPALLGGGNVPIVATVIDSMINEFPRWELASALSIVLLVACIAVFTIYRRIGGLLR